jgi:hypothetical protein
MSIQALQQTGAAYRFSCVTGHSAAPAAELVGRPRRSVASVALCPLRAGRAKVALTLSVVSGSSCPNGTKQMPHIQTRIGGRRTSAQFRVERPRVGRTSHPISRVHQHDEHSCGFLAALMVIRYFDPTVSTRDVLAALLPSPVRGCRQRELIRALSQFGIRARYRERLGCSRLQGLAKAGCPVIITIHPDEWLSDHWTVVRGLRERSRRILLSNPGPRGYEYEGLAQDGSMSWRDFKGIWSPRGAGLVCESK